MGKGVKRKITSKKGEVTEKRVFTFTLDEQEDEKLIKWLEDRSTTSTVKEALEKLKSGGFNGVSPVQNTELVNRLLDTIDSLTDKLANITAGTSINSQMLEAKEQQSATKEKEEPIKEPEPELDEKTQAYVDEQSQILKNIDPTSFASL